METRINVNPDDRLKIKVRGNFRNFSIVASIVGPQAFDINVSRYTTNWVKNALNSISSKALSTHIKHLQAPAVISLSNLTLGENAIVNVSVVHPGLELDDEFNKEIKNPSDKVKTLKVEEVDKNKDATSSISVHALSPSDSITNVDKDNFRTKSPDRKDEEHDLVQQSSNNSTQLIGSSLSSTNSSHAGSGTSLGVSSSEGPLSINSSSNSKKVNNTPKVSASSFITNSSLSSSASSIISNNSVTSSSSTSLDTNIAGKSKYISRKK